MKGRVQEEPPGGRTVEEVEGSGPPSPPPPPLRPGPCKGRRPERGGRGSGRAAAGRQGWGDRPVPAQGPRSTPGPLSCRLNRRQSSLRRRPRTASAGDSSKGRGGRRREAVDTGSGRGPRSKTCLPGPGSRAWLPARVGAGGIEEPWHPSSGGNPFHLLRAGLSFSFPSFSSFPYSLLLLGSDGGSGGNGLARGAAGGTGGGAGQADVADTVSGIRQGSLAARRNWLSAGQIVCLTAKVVIITFPPVLVLTVERRRLFLTPAPTRLGLHLGSALRGQADPSSLPPPLISPPPPIGSVDAAAAAASPTMRDPPLSEYRLLLSLVLRLAEPLLEHR